MDNQQLILFFIKKCLFDLAEELTSSDIENIDFSEIFRISRKNSVANMVALGIKKSNIALPKDIEKDFNNSLRMSGYLYEIQTNDLQSISEKLEEFKIPHVALKGSHLRQFYPEPYLRTCSDIDILYNSSAEQIMDIFMAMHYAYYVCVGNTVVFRRKPFIYVEMHSSLYEETHKFKEKFDDIWSVLIKRDGTEYTYDMSEEDFYVYMLTHLANHFYSGGSGIRSIVDIYIYNLKIGNKIDRNKIKMRLKTLNMLKFEQSIIHLGKVWFENEPETELDRDLNTFVFESGTYGTYKNIHALEYQNSRDLTSDKNSLKLKLLFPNLKYMQKSYPVLIKAPMLLPLMWITRLFKVFTPKRKNALNQLRLYNNINENYNNFISNIFENLGI